MYSTNAFQLLVSVKVVYKIWKPYIQFNILTNYEMLPHTVLHNYVAVVREILTNSSTPRIGMGNSCGEFRYELLRY